MREVSDIFTTSVRYARKMQAKISRGTVEPDPPVKGGSLRAKYPMLITTWNQTPQDAAKCKTNFVAALSIMARRRSEPCVRPAIGGPRACSRRSLRRAPRFACLPQAGIRVSRPGEGRAAIFANDAEGWKIKTLRSIGSGGSVEKRMSARVMRNRPQEPDARHRLAAGHSTVSQCFPMRVASFDSRSFARRHVREGAGFYARAYGKSRAGLGKRCVGA